jgi:hypothetical protein
VAVDNFTLANYQKMPVMVLCRFEIRYSSPLLTTKMEFYSELKLLKEEDPCDLVAIYKIMLMGNSSC